LIPHTVLSSFYKVAPCFPSHRSWLCSYVWNLVDFFVIDERQKRKKSAKWIFTVQCTQEPRGMTLRNHTSSVPWMLAVTSTPYHEWPRSHQLRTMNERGHTNSVAWMNAVTPTPYHECTQFVDSVKLLLFRPIANIHGTELVWQRSFMVRSWCDLVKWPYGVQKSA
jgi:hypothetical protein